MKKIMLIILLVSSMLATGNNLKWPKDIIHSAHPVDCKSKQLILDYKYLNKLKETEQQIDYLHDIFVRTNSVSTKKRVLEKLSEHIFLKKQPGALNITKYA